MHRRFNSRLNKHQGLALFAFFLGCLLSPLFSFAESTYLAGAGVADITGPAAGVGMMGYVQKDQVTSGIHQRLWARAFVISDLKHLENRVVFVVADLCHIFPVVKEKVIQKLRLRFQNLYEEKNIVLMATHTHSGPGGYSHYPMFNFRTGGYSEKNFRIIVDGIVSAVERAHRNAEPAVIRFSQGELLGVSVNRSVAAYLLNPAWERKKYTQDTDKEMSVFKFVSTGGKDLGMLSFFAVHPTSMENNNLLISGDNKGFASYLFEKEKGLRYPFAQGFVAAFANSNAGDVSPNVAKDVDGDGDWDCLKNENFACTYESGLLQFTKAKSLFESANQSLKGPLDVRLSHVDFSTEVIEPRKLAAMLEVGKTCKAAIGLSMLAGSTEDGPGIGAEGQSCSHLIFPKKALCYKDPCHGAKPVVYEPGKQVPVPGSPQILPLQLVRIGQIVFVAVPAEFTTMSGRRLRGKVKDVLSSLGVEQVILAGYANAYAGYVATREEYQGQHYEGASTHFGEWTLHAYEKNFLRLAQSMVDGVEIPLGPPLFFPAAPKPYQAEPGADSLPLGKTFGDRILDAKPNYRVGQQVTVRFWGGHLSHSAMTERPMKESGFLEVQREDGEKWIPIAFDWDWETKLYWRRLGLSRSEITVEWDIPKEVQPGRFRILHRGFYQTGHGNMFPYVGISRTFNVTPF